MSTTEDVLDYEGDEDMGISMVSTPSAVAKPLVIDENGAIHLDFAGMRKGVSIAPTAGAIGDRDSAAALSKDFQLEVAFGVVAEWSVMGGVAAFAAAQVIEGLLRGLQLSAAEGSQFSQVISAALKANLFRFVEGEGFCLCHGRGGHDTDACKKLKGCATNEQRVSSLLAHPERLLSWGAKLVSAPQKHRVEPGLMRSKPVDRQQVGLSAAAADSRKAGSAAMSPKQPRVPIHMRLGVQPVARAVGDAGHGRGGQQQCDRPRSGRSKAAQPPPPPAPRASVAGVAYGGVVPSPSPAAAVAGFTPFGGFGFPAAGMVGAVGAVPAGGFFPDATTVLANSIERAWDGRVKSLEAQVASLQRAYQRKEQQRKALEDRVVFLEAERGPYRARSRSRSWDRAGSSRRDGSPDYNSSAGHNA